MPIERFVKAEIPAHRSIPCASVELALTDVLRRQMATWPRGVLARVGVDVESDGDATPRLHLEVILDREDLIDLTGIAIARVERNPAATRNDPLVVLRACLAPLGQEEVAVGNAVGGGGLQPAVAALGAHWTSLLTHLRSAYALIRAHTDAGVRVH